MAEEITHNVAAQWGAIGILLAVLLSACAVLWRRLVKLQDDYFEQTVQHTAALVTMTRLRAAMAAHAAALADVNRSLAAACERMAETGIFLATGLKCAWCLHSIPGGCRLRLLNEKTPPERGQV